jgi:hypothetical protein
VAIIDYFPAALAADGNGVTVKNAAAQVYALSDTSLSNPLALTDLQGVPIAALQSSDVGIYPAFRVVNGTMQVVVVSGSLRTPMTSLSVYANAAEAAAGMASGSAGAASVAANAAALARQHTEDALVYARAARDEALSAAARAESAGDAFVRLPAGGTDGQVLGLVGGQLSWLNAGSSTPAVDNALLTEAGAFLVSESNDNLLHA